MQTAPPPINRCPLDRFCWERDLGLVELGEIWGCSHEHARRIRRPFGHPDRKTPSPELIARIENWSEGVITLADHYPPKPVAEEPVSEAAPAASPASDGRASGAAAPVEAAA